MCVFVLDVVQQEANISQVCMHVHELCVCMRVGLCVCLSVCERVSESVYVCVFSHDVVQQEGNVSWVCVCVCMYISMCMYVCVYVRVCM